MAAIFAAPRRRPHATAGPVPLNRSGVAADHCCVLRRILDGVRPSARGPLTAAWLASGWVALFGAVLGGWATGLVVLVTVSGLLWVLTGRAREPRGDTDLDAAITAPGPHVDAGATAADAPPPPSRPDADLAARVQARLAAMQAREQDAGVSRRHPPSATRSGGSTPRRTPWAGSA